MDYVSKVVTVIKDVLAGVHKHFELVCHSDLESYEEDLLLLVKDHNNVFELETAVFGVFEWNSVEFVLCSALVVVGPDASLSLQYVPDFDLFLQEVPVVTRRS